MTGHAKISGTWRTLDGISAKVSGTWRTVTNGYVRAGGTWREFFTNMTVNAGSNVSSSAQGFSACGNPGQTGNPGASVSGGTAPYTYLWEQIGTPATSGPYNCSNTASLNPFWSESSVCLADSIKAETWRLTVTDDNGATATDTITVTLSWVDLS